jgi:hypothetical protein
MIPARIEDRHVRFFSDIDKLEETINAANSWDTAHIIDPYIGSGSSASVPVVGKDEIGQTEGGVSPGQSAVGGAFSFITVFPLIATLAGNPYLDRLESILNTRYTDQGVVAAKMQRIRAERSPHDACDRRDCQPTLYQEGGYQYRAILDGLFFFTAIDQNRGLHNYVARSYITGSGYQWLIKVENANWTEQPFDSLSLP